MKYVQPKLPYADGALSPVISAETIEYHYGKHTKSYIENLNKLIADSTFENMALEDVIRHSDGPVYNNAAQAWNHIFYFFSLSSSGGSKPLGKLADAINMQYDSFDNFKHEFEAAGLSLFGSGWVWLSYDADGKLYITKESNAGNPMTHGLTPLLAIDVWEHAYYIDYKNMRGDYLKNMWNIIDWNVVSGRYKV